VITTLDLWRKRQEKPKHQYTKPYDPSPSKHLHLSQAGGCARKETLRLLGYPAEPTPSTMQERWDQGKFWEEFVAALWQAEYGSEIMRQVPLETDYGIGYIDVLRIQTGTRLDDDPVSGYHIIEIKTTTSDKRNWLPDKGYIDQLMLYGHFFGEHHTNVTLELVYFVMDTREILSYPVEMDRERVGVLLSWLHMVQFAVQDKDPLPVQAGYRPNKFPCSWLTAKVPGHCAFYDHCWTESGHVIE